MKKTRKGFTLVELLIVIAILGALSATMATSVKGATAKAKASAIASNVQACISAARLYAINHAGDELASTTTDEVLYESFPAWKDFNRDASENTIIYKAVTDSAGEDNWAIDVDFSNDPDKEGIVENLTKIHGFGKTYNSANDSGTPVLAKTTTGENSAPGVYKFRVKLSSGQFLAVQ